MKRQSIAEQTLNKQITEIDQAIAICSHQQSQLQAKVEAFLSIKDDMEREVAYLKAQRIRASEINKHPRVLAP